MLKLFYSTTSSGGCFPLKATNQGGRYAFIAYLPPFFFLIFTYAPKPFIASPILSKIGVTYSLETSNKPLETLPFCINISCKFNTL